MNARAYAKINLGLRVLRKREDGYHDIETVFHQIDLFDELHFKLHEGEVILKTDDERLPTDSTNLCVKAATLLRDLTGTADGVEIYLQKKIPVGAGLGGGSADAAVTLKSLRQLWNLEISDVELHSLALALGSDVPFFLTGGTAYAIGRGDQLETMTFSIPYWIVVATPPVRVSTAWAYKSMRQIGPSSVSDLRTILTEHGRNIAGLMGKVVNDFEDVVFPAYPEVQGLKARFQEAGAAFSLMSGSGSSVFAFFREKAAAVRFAARYESDYAISLTEPNFSPPQSPAVLKSEVNPPS